MRCCQLILTVLLTCLAALPATAKPIERGVQIEIKSREPVFGGESFGEYGPYERIVGLAYMKIDPKAPENRGIVDLALAHRDAEGLVRYETDVVILRPIDPSKGRRILLYDVVNRGLKTAGLLNGGSIGLADPIDKGDALLMRQGVTIVWSGWQGDVVAPGMIKAYLPLLDPKHGPITGRTSTETIFDRADGSTIRLPYSAASLDQKKARLTVRALTGSPPRLIPASEWKFLDDTNVEITRPADMDAGAIYRFDYEATNPKVMGLGFAATRDLVSFLRQGSAEDGNPLADFSDRPCEKRAIGTCPNAGGGAFSTAIAFGVSQSGRYLRDFLWQGFNRGLDQNMVFDGMLIMVPGARRTFTNFRFAEPGRFSRQHEDHDVPGFDFPFAYATVRDPVTGKTDGILRKCTATLTCPKIMHFDTGAEFWQAGASLVGTGGTSRDVPFPPDVRAYVVASAAHVAGMAGPACLLPPNMMNYAPVQRALFIAMIDWTLDRQAPPDSRWPRLAAGELRRLTELRSPSVPSLKLAWPKVLNQPIPPAGKPEWPTYVPIVDTDGNELPGIRLPPVAVPTATLLPWNLRKAGFGEGDLCLIFGGQVPFAADQAGRGDDPRPSLAERYRTPGSRAAAVQKVTAELQRDRLLLPEDAAAADRPVEARP